MYPKQILSSLSTYKYVLYEIQSDNNNNNNVTNNNI